MRTYSDVRSTTPSLKERRLVSCNSYGRSCLNVLFKTSLRSLWYIYDLPSHIRIELQIILLNTAISTLRCRSQCNKQLINQLSHLFTRASRGIIWNIIGTSVGIYLIYIVYVELRLINIFGMLAIQENDY